MLLATMMFLAAFAGQDPAGAPARPASPWAAAQPADAPPVARESDCGNAANRAAGESEGGCIMRFRRMGPTAVADYAVTVRARNPDGGQPATGRLGFRIAPGPVPDDQPVPATAFNDPEGWKRRQCGAEPEETCRRAARNRLAIARAGLAETAPPEAAAPAASPRCRNIWRRAEDGVGGSFTRVCGDGDGESGVQMLEDLRRGDAADRRDAERNCERRPETTDQGVRWVLVCGTPYNRERANDALDDLLD